MKRLPLPMKWSAESFVIQEKQIRPKSADKISFNKRDNGDKIQWTWLHDLILIKIPALLKIYYRTLRKTTFSPTMVETSTQHTASKHINMIIMPIIPPNLCNLA